MISLLKPLNIGQTLHSFIMLQFENYTTEGMAKVNLPDDLKDQATYAEDAPEHDILSHLLKIVAGVKSIVVPGDFKSGVNGTEAVQCQVKVSEGYLYPLKNSLVFIQKPILYIRHKDVKYVEFLRIGQGGNQGTGRNFDLTIKMIDQDATNETFKNIDKKELGVLVKYFKGSSIKMRQIDSESGKSKEMEFNEKEYDQEL